MTLVADRVNDYVSRLGIKKTVLSRSSGIPYGTVASILSGRRSMTVEQYQSICKALEVKPSFFMEESDDEWLLSIATPTREA